MSGERERKYRYANRDIERAEVERVTAPALLSDADREALRKAQLGPSADLFALVESLLAAHGKRVLEEEIALYGRTFENAPTQDAVHVLSWLRARAARIGGGS